MLLFSNSLFLSWAWSPTSTTSKKKCSLLLFGGPVLVIILVNIISCANGEIDTAQQLSYYQSLARHLNDFTVKDDMEDLLAMPSDSNVAVVVAPPPSPAIARSGPITQYAQTTAKNAEQSEQKEQLQKHKKVRGHRRHHHRPQPTEDNVAQESNAEAAVAYAPAPSSFTTSNKMLYHRSSSDNVAQESYQSNAYAPPPPSASSATVSEKSYDQYTKSSSSSTAVKDNQAQESYSSNSYAPPPAASSKSYPQYHRDASSAATSKDSVAQESYQSRSYTPSSSLTPAAPPAPSQPPASAKSYYDQYHRSSSSSNSVTDNHAQESHQAPMSYAPPPAPAASDKRYATVNDNHAQESYHAPKTYAPPPPAAPSSSSYYPSSQYSRSSNDYPSSSYYPQSGAAPPPPPPSVTAYSPPYSPSSYGSPQAAPSSHHDNYYPYSQTYQNDPVVASSYAPYPATTPPPAARAEYHRHLSYYSTPKPTILQPADSRTSASKNVVASASASSPLLAHHPHLTSIDNFQQEQKQGAASSNSPISAYARETFEFSPSPPPHIPPGPPQAPMSNPPTPPEAAPTQKDQSSEESVNKQHKLLEGALGQGLNIYKLALYSLLYQTPGQWLSKSLNFLASMSIPKEHYLNVISFVGVYLFLSMIFYKQDEILPAKCDDGDEHLSKEWHYHVGRRFVPAVHKVDEKLQRKFLKLFKGLHLEEDDDDDGGSSSEEEHSSLVNYINDMCPRGAFFYSLAPMHLEARMQVQKILVAQPGPAHVYAVAKDLLYKHKIHPKVWYLGLVAAMLERADMSGLKFPHPLDGIPDWFIPADLIQDEMDKYKARSLARALPKRVRRAAGGNSTKVILTTTSSPLTSTTSLATSSSMSTDSSNLTTASTTTKFTRKPLLFTRRSTTTYRPPSYSFFSGESGSFENFVLDGLPPHLKDKYPDYLPYDEETINDSVQKYQKINTNGKEGKYKPKKKTKKPKPSEADDQSQQQQDQEQDASNSASAEKVELDASNAIDTSASTETEADNVSNSAGGSSAASAQQNGNTNIDGTIMHDDESENEVAVAIPSPPSVRPSHLTSSHHNAIKVGDLTVVVGSGPSLLNDVPTYNLLDDKDKGEKYDKYEKYSKHRHEKGHKKGDKKGKGKGKDEDCIVVDGKVGRDNGIENKLWYFREDMMVSQNHWYWHLIHPVNATKHPDRRAELFFFTHRQFLARYNSERMSNGLHRMIHMTNLGPGGILVEPYHSHLADVASGKYWTPRHPKRLLRDIRHIHDPDIIKNIMLKDTATIYDRLIRSVQTGIMISTKGLLSIRNTNGIEPLANTVEATELSVNPGIYDAFGLHNMGHLIIGLVEDPDWNYKKTPGVMSEVATSMRDPIFYNYHALIDNIMERHKETLPPYKVVGGDFPLLWRGVKILDVEMVSKGNGPLNQLRTFWTKKSFELAPSVDRSTAKEDEHAKICAVHLAHEPFTFKVTIERKPCAKSKSDKGTIRIFIAPRFDEKGRRINLREQRRLMIQLDAFQAKLRIGRNTITRRSHDSSLTQPWTKHLHDFERKEKSGAADFCGCGWPQHLYIPKGNRKGMLFDLFVMVTNYDEDHVPNLPQDLALPETCNSPYLFCGIRNRKYPDRRPMGYPWDRPPYKTPIPCLTGHTFAAIVCRSFNLVAFKPIDFLEEFVAKAPNMKSIVFDIKHIDKLVKSYHRHH